MEGSDGCVVVGREGGEERGEDVMREGLKRHRMTSHACRPLTQHEA